VYFPPITADPEWSEQSPTPLLVPIIPFILGIPGIGERQKLGVWARNYTAGAVACTPRLVPEQSVDILYYNARKRLAEHRTERTLTERNTEDNMII